MPKTNRKYCTPPKEQARTCATTEDGILQFARLHGHLGVEEELGLSDSDEDYQCRVFGESLERWILEIEHLRHVIQVWEKIKAGNREDLGPHVKWDGTDSVSYSMHPRTEPSQRPLWSRDVDLHAWDIGPYEVLDLLKAEPVFEPARLFVHGMINSRLKNHVSKRLLFDDNRLHDVPKNLLGVIWLQFAQAIGGNRSFTCCKNCGTWFELSVTARRRDSLYCSRSCRFKAYRRRRDEARRMHTSGMQSNEIARALGVDTKSVSRWVAGGVEADRRGVRPDPRRRDTDELGRARRSRGGSES
jgi:hypothetical protein